MSEATRKDNLRHAHCDKDSRRRRQQHPLDLDILLRLDSPGRPLDISVFVPELHFVPPVASQAHVDNDNPLVLDIFVLVESRFTCQICRHYSHVAA